MIFGNGCWLQKEGCGCFTPQEVYFEKVEETRVTLCLPTTRIMHRGATLGGINLTMVITSPAPEVLRVRTYHHMGALQKGPEFALCQTAEQPLNVTSDEERIVVTSGTLSLEMGKGFGMYEDRLERRLLRQRRYYGNLYAPAAFHGRG